MLMIFLNVILDTQRVSAADVNTLLQGGQTLHAVGFLNTRWEEFSALEVAQNAGLTQVEWNTVADDTPGTLQLTVCYLECDSDSIRQRLAEMDGVDQNEI